MFTGRQERAPFFFLTKGFDVKLLSGSFSLLGMVSQGCQLSTTLWLQLRKAQRSDPDVRSMGGCGLRARDWSGVEAQDSSV